MAKRSGQKITLTSIDELLCVPDAEGTIDIEVDAIYPFENHPFKVVDDEKMEELVESIKLNGVLTPVLVRPDDEGTYEMVSGHRRLRAAKKAGIRKIPAIIKEMTDDEATIAMVDANVQREEILPSEKAFALKMKMDAMNHRGMRSDLTLSLEETKLHSAEEIGKAEGLGRAQVHRYIRLTYLNNRLLDMVDEKRLALSVAVELSYLNKNIQSWIYDYIKTQGMIRQEQLMILRDYRGDNQMTQDQLYKLLGDSVSITTTSKKITINDRKLKKYFPAYYSKAEMERVVYGLLEQWKQAQEQEAINGEA